MRKLLCLIILLATILSFGCQGRSMDSGSPLQLVSSPDPILTSTPLPDTSYQEIDTPDRTAEEMKETPERVPAEEEAMPITGEVPIELLDAILKDLAERTGSNPKNIVVIQSQAMVWNDGSLGCGRPGEFYTQAPVNGYWVILEVEDQKYDYRAANTGYFFLCEGAPRPNPPGTPIS